ncbi:MAG: hypothetical protein PVF83_18990 [Anaerolineales bacterium]
MSFHTMKSREERERETWPHPIWRGIGVIIIVVLPVLSFVISNELITYWEITIPGFILPYQMRQSVNLPILGEVRNFFGVLALAVIVTIALFALLSVINALVYRATRNKNVRAFESPPKKYKKKRKLKKAKDRYKTDDTLY